MDKEIQLTIEFEQFISRIKTNRDQLGHQYIDDNFLAVILLSYISRFFYICDDRQFYLIKSYLLDLMEQPFANKDEFYNLHVSQNILDLTYSSFSDAEKDAGYNIFGKGYAFPFNQAPVIVFGNKAYEENSKPFCSYKFQVKINNNNVYYQLHLPLKNPSNLFLPLSLGFILEYAFMNICNRQKSELSKQMVIDMLKCIDSRKFSESNLVNGILHKYDFLNQFPDEQTANSPMNFLDAFKIVDGYEGALAKKSPYKEDVFHPFSDLPYPYDKDLIISSFQIFFAHMILYQTRTPEQFDQYMITLKFISSFLPDEKIVHIRNIKKLVTSKSIFISKDKKEKAQKEYGDIVINHFTKSYRYDDVVDYVNDMQAFKNDHVLPNIKENEDINPIIENYIRKAYERAKIEYLDEYRFFFRSFNTLRQNINDPKYAQIYLGYETLIENSQ